MKIHSVPLVSFFMCGSLGAQELHYVFHGDDTFDELGRQVAGAGDLNGDGFADFIVGAADYDGPLGEGLARAFSGADGSILYELAGTSPSDFGDQRLFYMAGGSARQRLSRSRLLRSRQRELHRTERTAHGLGQHVREGEPARPARRGPPERFGVFLVSLDQDFVPFVGGSDGNLCLGGVIGRFAEVLSTGPVGTMEIAVDTQALPQGGRRSRRRRGRRGASRRGSGTPTPDPRPT